MSFDRGWSTVVVAATGPSFSVEQADAINDACIEDRCRVIAINDNWRLLHWADVLYACDGAWWNVHVDAIRAAGFKGELWTQHKDAAARHGLHYIEGKGARGLTTATDAIHNGRNSGYQAINLAYLFGAKRIVLVGFDMQRTGGRMHWFGDHPKPLSNDLPFDRCIKYFAVLAADLERANVTVINATADTALTCFKRATLEQALA